MAGYVAVSLLLTNSAAYLEIAKAKAKRKDKELSGPHFQPAQNIGFRDFISNKEMMFGSLGIMVL